jgi:hypothetical protein
MKLTQVYGFLLSVSSFFTLQGEKRTYRNESTTLLFVLSWGALWAKGRRKLPFAYVLFNTKES